MFKVINPIDILVSVDHTIAITVITNIKLENYKTLSWDEFIDLTVANELKTKDRRFNTNRLKDIKKILGIFCTSIGNVVVMYHEELLPLVFEFNDQYVILMAQYGAPIKIGDSYG